MNDKELIEKINNWHKYVVVGLNNGLTHTIPDGRTSDIKWVRGRLALFESFSRCIMDTIWGNLNKYNEKELKQISETGYNNKSKKEN